MLNIELQGEMLSLHHERAIYWPARKMLVIADTHFGKDAVFRDHAIPIPSGSAGHDLQRIDSLIEHTSAKRLLILGDFIHGPLQASQPFIQEFNQWRNRHTALHIDVVLGNHDRYIDKTMYQAVQWHDELAEGPFLFAHEPCVLEDAYVLSGHIHPVMRLKDGRGDAMRLPVFWFQLQQGTLPSFGSMTGGYPIKPVGTDQLYLVGPDAVVPYG